MLLIFMPSLHSEMATRGFESQVHEYGCRKMNFADISIAEIVIRLKEQHDTPTHQTYSMRCSIYGHTKTLPPPPPHPHAHQPPPPPTQTRVRDIHTLPPLCPTKGPPVREQTHTHSPGVSGQYSTDKVRVYTNIKVKLTLTVRAYRWPISP